MNDIVIPYLKNNTGELEACVDLVKRNFPHRRVHVIDKRFDHKSHVDQVLKLKWAIDNIRLTDEFYLFNDDFFIMKPVDGTPYFHKGLLKHHIESRKFDDTYTKTLRATLSTLGDEALSYELHVPFLFHKGRLKQLIDSIDTTKDVPLIRSFYGNTYRVGGEYMEDVKNPVDYKGATYLSTSNKTYRGEIGEYIRSVL